MPVVGQISVGDGATFTPSVSNSGVISWSNDKNLPNPASVDIAGVVQTAISGVYLPTAGGTVTGNLTVNGTLTGNLSGNATTATTATTATNATTAASATNDGNGNEITATYLPLAGGTLTGNLTENNDLIVNGNANLNILSTTGDATVGGDFDVVGNSTLASVSVSGNTTVTDLTADNITVTNDLSVTGASTFTGNITAGADITVTGDLSVNDITASGDITADDVTANGNLSVVGNATLNGTSTAVTPAEDDNSTNIATTAYVQTEIKPIETDVTINDKRISNIEKLLQGNLYDYQTDTDSAYTKTVPNGAMPYASLDSIGGKTLVWNQLCQNEKPTSTVNGVTFTNNGDGSWTINGTATANGDKTFGAVSVVQGHKYYLKGCPSGGSIATYYVNLSGVRGVDIGNGDVFTYDYAGLTTPNLRINFVSGTTFNNVKVYPQLTDLTLCYGAGNEPTTVQEFTAQFPAQYYPYNAGTLLSADVTSVVSNINLMNGVTVEQGMIGTTNGLNQASTTRVRTADFIAVKPSTSYIFSVYDTQSTPKTNVFCVYEYSSNVGTSFIKYTQISSVSGTVTLGATTQYVRVTFVSSNNSNIVPSEVLLPSIEYPTPIQTYPIPASIQALEGYGWSAGTVSNYIDYERKVFVKRVGAVTLDGTENWISAGGNAPYRYDPNNGKDYTTNETPNILTVYYTAVPWNASFTDYDKMVAYYASYWRFRDTSCADLSAWTTKLSANPLTVYYELATPIETDISAYITDDNLISVEAGGSLTFPNSNGDDYRINVPSAETYMIDLQSAL